MAGTRTNTLAIRTPEGIVFTLQLAGPVSRMLAVIVDAVLVWSACALLLILLGISGLFILDSVLAAVLLILFVAPVGYAIFCEWVWRGQTVGKRLLRLQVMDADGLKLQFSQVLIRNLLRFVDKLPSLYVVGGIASVLSQRCQRLGDFAANTIVVVRPRSVEPDLAQIGEIKFNSLREHPHLIGRLRQRIAPIEASAALQALLRRDDLEPHARVRLFGEMAERFRHSVEVPPEIFEGITDEQYVRNVVDALFQHGPAGKSDAARTP